MSASGCALCCTRLWGLRLQAPGVRWADLPGWFSHRTSDRSRPGRPHWQRDRDAQSKKTKVASEGGNQRGGASLSTLSFL